MQSIDIIKNNLNQAKTSLEALLKNDACLNNIVQASTHMVKAIQGGGRIFSCGNGGSMCDAMHFAEELSGRFQEDRKALPAVAISDPGYISCVANDFGYEQIFSRYLEAHGKEGDVLLAISTSGKSPNVLRALKKAKELKMITVGLTGKEHSEFESLSSVLIQTTTPSTYADRIQELHIKVIHSLIELIEKQVFKS